MRVLPVINRFSNRNNLNKNQTNFERSSNASANKSHHQYTGVASVDLAYASMFDNAIARDLKLMGLI